MKAAFKFLPLILIFAFATKICHCKAAAVEPVKKLQISFVENGNWPKTSDETKEVAPKVAATTHSTVTGLTVFALVLIALINTTIRIDHVETVLSFDPTLKPIVLRPRIRPNAP